MIGRRVVAVSLVVLALSAGLTAATAKKKGPPLTFITCGMNVFDSLRARNNLVNCPAHGLVVKAPGITIDLNGHSIDGTGDPAENGIDNSEGHDGVTVRNGAIEGFSRGVLMSQADDARVEGIDAANNTDRGIFLSQSKRAEISGNSAVDNSNEGILLSASSSDAVVTANATASNGNAGIVLGQFSDRGVVTGNSSLGDATGIRFQQASDGILARNRILNATVNGVTLGYGAANNRVVQNRIISAGGFGIVVDDFSDDNRIKRNVVRGSVADGIRLADADRVKLVSNTSSGNALRGIGIFTGSDHTIKGNRTDRNGLHGIESDIATITLRDNRAHQNGFGFGTADWQGWGIYAPAGTTNSGNRAKGNDNPEECFADDLDCHV